MLFQSAAVVPKKLLVVDKMPACVKQKFHLDVICKVSNTETLSFKKHFAFWKNVCYHCLNLVLRVTYCFFFYYHYYFFMSC